MNVSGEKVSKQVEFVQGRCSPFGDQALLVHYDYEQSPWLSRSLATRAGELRAEPFCLDAVIGYQEIVVHVCPSASTVDWQRLQVLLEEPLLLDYDPGNASVKTILVEYDKQHIMSLAGELGLSYSQVWQCHHEALYAVAFMGFRPFFPYLLGVAESLRPSRKSKPMRVRAGTVALAAGQAGIYPDEGWGGWWALGYCDPDRCHDLQAGDLVKFSGSLPC